LTPTSLEVFDFAEQGMVTGNRDTTTVATQALYLLNDPFVRRQSLALAKRLLAQAGSDDPRRIDRAYRLTIGRPPTANELVRAESYLAQFARAAGALIARAPATPEPRPILTVALSAGNRSNSSSGGGKAPVNPSSARVNQEPPATADDRITEDDLTPVDPRTAAWASFCQALLGSAEFRYIK